MKYYQDKNNGNIYRQSINGNVSRKAKSGWVRISKDAMSVIDEHLKNACDPYEYIIERSAGSVTDIRNMIEKHDNLLIKMEQLLKETLAMHFPDDEYDMHMNKAIESARQSSVSLSLFIGELDRSLQ